MVNDLKLEDKEDRKSDKMTLGWLCYFVGSERPSQKSPKDMKYLHEIFEDENQEYKLNNRDLLALRYYDFDLVTDFLCYVNK